MDCLGVCRLLVCFSLYEASRQAADHETNVMTATALLLRLQAAGIVGSALSLSISLSVMSGLWLWRL